MEPAPYCAWHARGADVLWTLKTTGSERRSECVRSAFNRAWYVQGYSVHLILGKEAFALKDFLFHVRRSMKSAFIGV